MGGNSKSSKGLILLLLSALTIMTLATACQGLLVETGTERTAVVINEIVSSSQSAEARQTNKAKDWIELYNGGDTPVHLEGFYLSDRPENLKKWVFPDIEVSAGGYLVIRATGEDKMTEDGDIHTNFKIDSKGEKLILTAPNGQSIVDYVNLAALPPDYSFGRQPDGSSHWFIFDQENATPGETNNHSHPFQRKLQAPVPSHPAGFYVQPFELKMDTEEEDVVIRYTLDGSEPTEDSPAFEDSIRIKSELIPAGGTVQEITQGVTPHYPLSYIDTNPKESKQDFRWYPPKGKVYKGTILRAKAFSPGAVPSETITSTYFVAPRGANRYTMPVLSVVTEVDNLFDYQKGIYIPGEFYYKNGYGDDWWGRPNANYYQRGDAWERPAHIEFFEPDGDLGFSQDVGIRIHAGGSRALPQKTLRVYARGEYSAQNNIEYELFPGLKALGTGKPIDTFKTILIRNGGQNYETQFIVGPMAQSLLKDSGVVTQASRPVIVFINGEYWGIHNIRERYDEYYFKSHYDLAPDEVAILENNGEIVHGAEEDARDYGEMIEYIKNHDMSVDQHYEHIQEQMDTGNFIYYQAFQIYSGNYDWPGNNIRFWRAEREETGQAPYWKDGRWRWMVYDLDYTFGSLSYVDLDYNSLIHATQEGGDQWPNPDWSTLLLRSLLDNKKFKEQFINTLLDQMNTIFKPDWVRGKLLQLQESFLPEMEEHIERWNRYPSPSVKEWEKNIDRMREFADKRPGFMYEDLMEFFDLEGWVFTRLDVTNPGQGWIQVNSIKLTGDVPGAREGIYPWLGVYSKGIPIQITAVPLPGCRFVKWEGTVNQYQNPLILVPEEGITLKAVFTEDS